MELLPQPSSRFFPATAVAWVALVMLLVALPLQLHAASSQLVFSPSSFSYGSVDLGQSKTLQSLLTNKGTTSITITASSLSNNQFTASNLRLPRVLGPGISIEVSVAFAPSSAGVASGQLSLTVKGSSVSSTLWLTGKGVGTVTATPANISFGKIAVGSDATSPVVLKNTGTSKVTLTSLKTSGTGFSVGGAKFPLTLSGGRSVTLTATFAPQQQGAATGDAYVAGPALNIPLSGTGTASSLELSITPGTLGFGNVAVGTTETLSAGLKATGGNVTVSAVSSNNAQFAVPGVTFPLTVKAGQEVLLNVTFTPSKDGNSSAKLTFQSNAADSPTSETLAGTGTAPYVSLSWMASSSPDVSGYNVYRSASKSGSYSKLNSSLNSDTSYTDTTVASGSTYYYATTAVNSSGQESTYSNLVKVVVP